MLKYSTLKANNSGWQHHRGSTSRRKWYPPADGNAYGRHTPWLAD